MAGISINNKFMRSYKQKHHQFELKGIKTGKNERRLLNSLSSSSRKLELFGCECPLFFKRRRKCLLIKGNLAMNGASALVYTGPMASTQSHELGLLSGAWRMERDPCPALVQRWHYNPIAPCSEGRALNQRWLFLGLKIWWNSFNSVLDVLETHHPFLLSYFPLLEWEYLSYAYFPLYFDST